MGHFSRAGKRELQTLTEENPGDRVPHVSRFSRRGTQRFFNQQSDDPAFFITPNL